MLDVTSVRVKTVLKNKVLNCKKTEMSYECRFNYLSTKIA